MSRHPQVLALPEKDRRAVIPLVNSLVAPKGAMNTSIPGVSASVILADDPGQLPKY